MNLLFASALDATLIVAAALAACVVFRRRSAAFRHVVLATAIATAALAPAFELLIPQMMIVHRIEPAPALSSSVVVTVPPAHDSTPVAVVAPAPVEIPWTTLVVYGWLIGTLGMLAVLGTSLLRLAHVVHRCTPLGEGPWQSMADSLAKTYGLRQRVAILLSTDRSLLVTCGLWQQKIVLPSGADRWADDRQRVVLTHELAHVRRRDGAIQLAAEILRVIHWFNPLVWIACRRLREESEHACDDIVLEAGIEPTEYATHLLEVARHAGRHHQAWGSAPAIAHPSTLERRVSAMLSPRKNRNAVTRRARAFVIVTIATASISLTAADVVTSPRPNPVLVRVSSDVTPVPPAAVEPVSSPVSPPPQLVGSERFHPSLIVSPSTTPTLVADTVSTTASQAQAAIVGAVIDQTGGAMPGASLTLTTSESGARQHTISDAAGRFAFRGLQAGQHTLMAAMPGFMKVTMELAAPPDGTLDRVLTLPIGTLEETIIVACSATRVGRTEPAVRQDVPTPAWFTPLALAQRGWNQIAQIFVPVVAAQQQNQRPIRVGGDIRPPTKVTDVRPACPGTAMPNSETTVRIFARVGADGAVTNVTYLPAPRDTAQPGELIDAALSAVRQWTFTPAALNGRPVDVHMTISVVFQPR